MKDPAVLWYWNDWIGGTMTFSRALKGAYMDLLGAQHNTGHLSLDEIKTVLGSDFGSMWPTLQKKFVKDDSGLYYNARAKTEKEKRQKFSQSRRSNLMGGHMENENIIERKNKFKDELSPFLEKYSREVLNSFFSYWTETNKTETRMRFEMQKTFEIEKRLVTWVNRNREFTKDKSAFPDYYDKEFESKLQPDALGKYWKHLRGLGWEKREVSPNIKTWVKAA